MSDAVPDLSNRQSLVDLMAAVVRAYVAHNRIPAGDLLIAMRDVHATLAALASDTNIQVHNLQKPAVSIRKSITPDYLVCLEDGKKLKMLKRYLRTNFGLSPEQYRAKWRLNADYPMAAPNYAAKRSEFAKKIGLGRTPSTDKRRKRS